MDSTIWGMTGLSNQQGYNLYPRRSVDMEYVVMAAGAFAGVLVYHILADIYAEKHGNSVSMT